MSIKATNEPALRRSVGYAARLGWAPFLTVLAFGLPILAGLVGTLLPAFGYLPALGSTTLNAAPWRTLLNAPGFGVALQATLVTGWLATLFSLGLALLVVAFLHHRPAGRRLGDLIAPLVAMPHSALAIGLVFLVAPSGWLVRWVSPGLTGWDVPPDISIVGHPSGAALVLALMLKEVPYLTLMLLAALNQVPARAQVTMARSLGYGPVQAWIAIVLPQVYRQIRLPVYAVLAFSLSVVDVALILGPGNPPTLAVLAVRWFSDPDTRFVFPAAAAATLLLGVVAASVLLWSLGERLAGQVYRRMLERGVRSGRSHALAAMATTLSALLLIGALLAMLGMTLWSFAAQWRYPAALPSAWTLTNWQRQASSVVGPALNTLWVGFAATLAALMLVLACLEHETRRGRHRNKNQSYQAHALWLLYLPLLVPQIAFLFGLQVLLVRIGGDGQLLAVIAVHLVFVVPYLFLSLADPWRSFDQRYARTASSLGASGWRVFWRIKLPILLKPVLVACAVAFAVSVGQYLPTLFAGAGRVATLTTEAVTLSAGADRRVIGVWAVLQAAFPLLVFFAAAAIPRWLYRDRKALL